MSTHTRIAHVLPTRIILHSSYLALSLLLVCPVVTLLFSLLILSGFCRDLGDLEGSKTLYKQACRLRKSRASCKPIAQAAAMSGLGMTQIELGSFPEALELQENSRAILMAAMADCPVKKKTRWTKVSRNHQPNGFRAVCF